MTTVLLLLLRDFVSAEAMAPAVAVPRKYRHHHHRRCRHDRSRRARCHRQTRRRRTQMYCCGCCCWKRDVPRGSMRAAEIGATRRAPRPRGPPSAVVVWGLRLALPSFVSARSFSSVSTRSHYVIPSEFVHHQKMYLPKNLLFSDSVRTAPAAFSVSSSKIHSTVRANA